MALLSSCTPRRIGGNTIHGDKQNSGGTGPPDDSGPMEKALGWTIVRILKLQGNLFPLPVQEAPRGLPQTSAWTREWPMGTGP